MRPKAAFYWCASCGGCEEAVVDLELDLLTIADTFDIVMWPVALDFKRKDVEALDDGAVAIAFINGAVRTTEQQEYAQLLRMKSRVVVAVGACAQLGGIPGLANLTTSRGILQEAYNESPPSQDLVPRLFEAVLPLDRVVPVDYYIPGCPPSTRVLKEAFAALLSETPPPPGTALAPDHCLCEECPRKETRPDNLTVDHFDRPHRVAIDQHTCMLAQSVACLGAATRAGCGARCIEGNMPCTGCFGPTSHVRDYGAKALVCLASIIGTSDVAEIDRIVDGIPDPVGLFYRYSLPSSFLQRKRQEPPHANAN